MKEDKFPIIPPELMKILNEVFPEQSYNLGTRQEEYIFHGGQRSVIRFLQYKFEEQSSNILDREIL